MVVPFPPGALVNGKFKIDQLIRMTPVGHVYGASQVDKNEQGRVVLKFDLNDPQDKEELEMIRMTQGIPYFATLLDEGVAFDLPFFATLMEGRDFYYLFHKHGVFGHLDTLLFGYHATQALQQLHQRGILHGDVKIDNFVLATSPTKCKLVLIDHGLSERFDVIRRDFRIWSKTHRKLFRSDPVVVRGGRYTDSSDMFGLLFSLRYLSGYGKEWNEVVGAQKTFNDRAEIMDRYCTELENSLVPEDVPFFSHVFKALFECGGRGELRVDHEQVVNAIKSIKEFDPNSEFSFNR